MTDPTLSQFLQSVEEVKNLPPRTKLAELVIALVEADTESSVLWARYGHDDSFDGDAAHDADNAAFEAVNALRDYLAREHGLTYGQMTALARNL